MASSDDDRHSEFLKKYMTAYASIRTYVYSLVRDLHITDDILQEVALVTWSRIGEYDPAQPFVAWALRIARNKCLSFLRERRMAVLPEELMSKLEGDVLLIAEQTAQRRKVLEKCINGLSDDARKTLLLRFQGSLTPQQIARQQGRSYSAVRKIITRARAFLMRCTERTFATGVN